MKYLLVFFMGFIILEAECQFSIIKHYSIEDGLSQGMIFDICQTKDGYLWFATKDGLNRFDGYDFETFRYNPFDKSTISSNHVTCLFEDKLGRFWIGTREGLNLFDGKSHTFTRFTAIHKDENNVEDNSIVKINEDAKHNLIVLTKGMNLQKISIHTDHTFRSNETIGKVPYEVTNRADILVLPNEKILVRYRDVLSIIEANKTLKKEINIKTSSLLLDKNNIWSGNNEYLTKYDLNLNVLQKYKKPQDNQDAIIGIAKDRLSGDIYFTDAYNLYVLRSDVNTSEYVLNTKENNTTKINFDHNNNMWLGTNGYGAFKCNLKKNNFKNYIKDVSVWSFFKDKKERTWIKNSDKYYLLSKDKNTLSLAPFLEQQSQFYKNLTQDESGNYWALGINYDSLQYFKLIKFDAKENYQFSKLINGKLPPLNAQVKFDKDGKLWIGANNGKLFSFDMHTNVLKEYSYSHLFDQNKTNLEVISMEFDNSQYLWLGTTYGLVRVAFKDNLAQYKLYRTDIKNKNSLSNEVISCIIPKNESLMLGTKGGGIAIFDKKTEIFYHIDEDDGLVNNVVYGIVPFKEDVYWISTNKGLISMKWRPGVKPAFNIFGKQDGITMLEYNTNAFGKSAYTNEISFGGINGLVSFNPDLLTIDTIPPKIHITGLEINNKKVKVNDGSGILDIDFQFKPNISLHREQSTIKIKFATIHYVNSFANKYKYRVREINDQWVEIGSVHEVFFSQLNAGSYTFEVLGANDDGVWSISPATLQFTIKPYWYMSIWAKLIYLIIGAYLTYRLYLVKVKQIELTSKINFEEKEAERLKQLVEMKTHFFENITHELRTPLSLILGPIQQLKSKISNIEDRFRIDIVQSNATKLLNLINQLLDLTKLDSKMMEPDLRKVNLNQLLEENLKNFEEMAKSKGIKITFQPEISITDMITDASFVDKIFTNIVFNALKFTPEEGQIDIHLIKQENRISIIVADTGSGIPEEMKETIFERFVQEKSSLQYHTGTGIGLALAKELIQKLNGTIKVQSQLGKGSTFFIDIPYQKSQTEIASSPFIINDTAFAESDNKTILIAEDNDEMRAFIALNLREHYQLILCSDGEEALIQAIEKIPDLIISDYMMPRTDGNQFCEAVKQHQLTNHIPFIMLTAISSQSNVIQAHRYGADMYMIKPFNMEELLVKINILINTRELLKMKYQNNVHLNDVEVQEVLSSHDKEFIERLDSLILIELSNENLSIEELASKMYLSRMQLHRKIKALTNESTSVYLRNVRLKEAKILLEKKSGNVSEIAYKVGFSNEKYFSTVFKEKYGLSPSEVK